MSTVQFDATIASRMLDEALDACAAERFNGSVEQTRLALHQGQCEVCRALKVHLVEQVGAWLGGMDRTVKAIYAFEPETSPARSATGSLRTPISPGSINLIAWVERKSAALGALCTTLETVLADCRSQFGCRNATRSCFTLDVAMVDDQDVQERRGYGMLVEARYLQTLPVWTRPDAAAPPPASQPPPGSARQLVERSFDAELAPESLLFAQALAIENLPPQERLEYEPRLREIKVVLIRRLISDQLAYIRVARDWLTIQDLETIHRRRIGPGKIGGKAAGLALAVRILQDTALPEVLVNLRIPESYYIGSDLIYIFSLMNGLMHWNEEKYKPEEQIRQDYPLIQQQFVEGRFPPEILKQLAALLEQMGSRPLIVRSSSQLEDSVGTSFAGKYNSYFCPNQGSPQENLEALTRSIALTFASTLKPEALLYRRQKGLQDYDERMAVLIQEVQGEPFGRYFLPHAAGVAFSRNLYRWAPQIRREDGFVRMVWGLGTRAVERVGSDYPRLVALSHPTLQPDDDPRAIRHYSQTEVDLIDLQENAVCTLPVRKVITPDYPPLRYMVQVDEDGVLLTPRGRLMQSDLPRAAITYDEFLRRTAFAPQMRQVLRLLEEHTESPVDVEFCVHLAGADTPHPRAVISLLQCRPQAFLRSSRAPDLPRDLPPERIIFSTRFVVPQGYLPEVRYVLFVTPEGYFSLPDANTRRELTLAISKLNAALKDQPYLAVGPGRWGTTNPDLGVYISYADIFNASALVELSGPGIGPAPEPSLGTHFFQDLMEAQIFPLAIALDDPATTFNRAFFYDAPSCLAQFIALPPALEGCLRLVEVAAFAPGFHMEVVMNDDAGLAVAYLSPMSL